MPHAPISFILLEFQVAINKILSLILEFIFTLLFTKLIKNCGFTFQPGEPANFSCAYILILGQPTNGTCESDEKIHLPRISASYWEWGKEGKNIKFPVAVVNCVSCHWASRDRISPLWWEVHSHETELPPPPTFWSIPLEMFLHGMGDIGVLLCHCQTENPNKGV